jgi:hypothetical protein
MVVALPLVAQQKDNSLDRRVVTVIDSSGAQTQVSEIEVRVNNSALESFDIAYSEQKYQFVVITTEIQLAISSSSLLSVEAQAGGKSWTARYQTQMGEASVAGSLVSADLTGASDFGKFSAPVTSLKRLLFSGPGIANSPPPKKLAFAADITLLSGVVLKAVGVRRVARYVYSFSQNTIPATFGSTTRYDHSAEFQFTRGDALQTIPFGNTQSVEFSLPSRSVAVTARTGAKAEMSLPGENEQSPLAFTGLSGFSVDRGAYFYVPLQFVKSINFVADAAVQ